MLAGVKGEKQEFSTTEGAADRIIRITANDH